jgi:hypothetical protein
MPMFEDKNAFIRRAASLGDQEAKGQLCRPEFMVACAVASHESVIATDDAADAWGAFKKKQAARLNGAVVTNERTSEKATAVRVSEIRQIILAGAKPYGNRSFADVLNDARGLIATAKASGDYKGNTQDAFVAIARAQIKSPDAELTEEQIVEAFLPTPKAKDRKEADELGKVVKVLERIVKGSEGTETSPPKEAFPSEAADEAIQVLKDRIAVLTLAAPK